MPKIKTLFAFITTDENEDDEGVTAWKFGNDWMPLMGADETCIESLRKYAKLTARATGKKIILAKFTKREDIEVIDAK